MRPTSIFFFAFASGFKMKRRVGAIEEFEFDAVSEEKDLHVVIAVSGWLTRDTLGENWV